MVSEWRLDRLARAADREAEGGGLEVRRELARLERSHQAAGASLRRSRTGAGEDFERLRIVLKAGANVPRFVLGGHQDLVVRHLLRMAERIDVLAIVALALGVGDLD